MFEKKILSVVAVALVGLSTSVGCAAPDEEETTGESEDALLLGGLKQSAPLPELAADQKKPSPVECSGHQDEGGRICCDATHCCINIGGVINCKLPPPKKCADCSRQ